MDPLQLPKLTKYVNDLSGILSSSEIETLSKLFVEHETRTTEQVTTLLFPHRQGHELLEIGLKVFNENGVGQKDLNNGLLLIIATEEKKIRIVTGKGMEIKYSEMRCRDIIEKELRPLLNAGKYIELIQAWHNAISRNDDLTNISPSNSLNIILRILFIIIATFIAIISYLGFSDAYLYIFAGKLGLQIGCAFSLIVIIAFIRIARSVSRVFSFGRWGENKMSRILWLSILITISIFLGIWKFTQLYCSERTISPDIVEISCTRTILGKTFQYSGTGYTESYKAAHPQEFQRSSSSSSHSSFGGGGGSSNGGGGGD